MWPRISAVTGRVARLYASGTAVATAAATGISSRRRACGGAAHSTPGATHNGSTGRAMTAQARVAGPVPPPERQITDSMIWWAPSSSGSAANGRSHTRRSRATHATPMAAMPVPATRSAVALQHVASPRTRRYGTGATEPAQRSRQYGIGHFRGQRYGSECGQPL
ncbi:hypothetical protein GCM10009647_062430 [Streptomyces sanglieri]